MMLARSLARRGNTTLAVGSRRWLSSSSSTSSGDGSSDVKEEDVRLLYELPQGYKYRAVSGIGSMYTASWMTYCCVEAYYAPAGSIANNVGILSAMGVASVVAGSYVVSQLASKTVGRIELVRGKEETIRITRYSAIGSEVPQDVQLSDIVQLQAPNENRYLKAFTLQSDYDESRPYYVQIDSSANIKDEEQFNRVLRGLKKAPVADHMRFRRRNKRKKYPSTEEIGMD